MNARSIRTPEDLLAWWDTPGFHDADDENLVALDKAVSFVRSLSAQNKQLRAEKKGGGK